MKNLRLHPFSLLVAGTTGLLASPAVAQPSCETDRDCYAGFVCEVVAISVCPEPVCPEGEECQPLECEPEERRTCVAEPCESDDDCEEGLSCVIEESEICTTAACAPDQDCGEIESTCETVTDSTCLPQWALPCESAQDCGEEGFECVEQEICSCPGTGTTAPEQPPGDCECSGSGEFHCEPHEIECESDSDCPSEWSCETVGPIGCEGVTVRPTTGSGGSTGGGEAPVSSVDPSGVSLEGDGGVLPDAAVTDLPLPGEAGPPSVMDADVEEIDDCVQATTSMCLPPFWDVGNRGGPTVGVDEDTASTGESGGQEPEPSETDGGTDDDDIDLDAGVDSDEGTRDASADGVDAGTEPDDDQPGDAGVADAGTSSDDDEVTIGIDAGADERPSGGESDGDSGAVGPDAGDVDSGGADDDGCDCTLVGGNPPSNPAWLAAALAWLFVSRRRRRHGRTPCAG